MENLITKKVRNGIYATKNIYTGLIRIGDRGFLGHTMTSAIAQYRKISPAHPAKQVKKLNTI